MGWAVVGWVIVVATYAVVIAFYLRLAVHALRWWEAVLRTPARARGSFTDRARAAAGWLADILLLRRLLFANPALWFGAWGFHAALALVLLRHVRFFVDPVPPCVAAAQIPAWIAAWLLPATVLSVLMVRAVLGRSQYTSRANLLVLAGLLGVAATGLLLATRHRVDLVQVKGYALGIVTFQPSPPPADWLLAAHLGLAAALALYVPSHVFTAPLTLLDARRRDLERERVLHDG